MRRITMKIKTIAISGLLALGLLTACDKAAEQTAENKAPETAVTIKVPVVAPVTEVAPVAPTTEVAPAPAPVPTN